MTGKLTTVVAADISERPISAKAAAGMSMHWLPLIVLPAGVLLLFPASQPRWAIMWTLSVAVFAGCKWLTWATASPTDAPGWRQVAYLLAWPGLDPNGFLRKPDLARVAAPTSGEWWFAASKAVAGFALVFLVARRVPTASPYLAGWLGMAGIVFCLHFGLLHLLSCAWRSIGIEARPLMHWPIAAISLADFWANRWNTAFRDLTHRSLFRPLTLLIGARGALLIGFLFSGVIHDVVISGSAGAGWGLPTLFFVIQATGIFFERSKLGKHFGLARGWRGWLFAALLLIVPAPLLFTPVFVERIVLPFLQAIGAIS
ncbi:MBOAT family protein [Anatilimnocola floriformis]|uniref:MBOAT family protein n=1 Tax=Anatilimnocola floriformis TaxID=2948575 RepID=UPI0020C279C1|nr:MBOAT family protein [Anatilimnocola floriformis]